MTYIYYITICLFAVVFEMSIMPGIGFLNGFYDLLIPFTVYLGLFRTPRESLPVILCAGFVMDTLSGGPFGLYMTSYFWLYVAIKGAIRYLHVRSTILSLLVVPIGVLFQNLLIFLTLTTMNSAGSPVGAWSLLLEQTIWALITGPIFVALLLRMHRRLDSWTAMVSAERNGS